MLDLCRFLSWFRWDKIMDLFLINTCFSLHSDGTHSLQRIHWWASDVMLHFSKSFPMKKQTHLHWMAWGWIHFLQIKNFWVNYSFSLIWNISEVYNMMQSKFNANVIWFLLIHCVCVYTVSVFYTSVIKHQSLWQMIDRCFWQEGD